LDLGKRLLERRSALGLTQEQLGRRLQPAMTRASVANIEAGKQRVLAHTFVALAAALETTLNDLASPQIATDADIERELAGKIGSQIAANVLSRLAASSSTNGAENERTAGAKASGTVDRRVRHSRSAR
jgi:transcriptional regulator with XRE-family HTH domain